MWLPASTGKPPFLNLFLVIRQWEAFAHTFLYFFTVKGIVLYGIAVAFAKTVHELGHAYTAKHYGLKVPNLHHRAGALGKWYIRKTLLGMNIPCPERLSSTRTRFLILFAYTTWMYRLLLFLGIALLVYHLFFKALGVVLFSVEMVWFIGLPIWGSFGSGGGSAR